MVFPEVFKSGYLTGIHGKALIAREQTVLIIPERMQYHMQRLRH
jgi:hypothetical protein